MLSKHYTGVIGLAIVGICLGCATSTVPGGWLPSATEAQFTVYGAWIEVTYSDDGMSQRADGEFIAVSDDSLYCLNNSGLRSIPLHTVSKAKITAYDAHHGILGAWTILGTLSTGSHGMLAAGTAPLWIITGTISTAVRSHEPVSSTGAKDWSEFKMYARYPAGLPKNLDRSQLRMKTVLTPSRRSRRGR